MKPTRILLAVRPKMLCEVLSEALSKRLGEKAHLILLKPWRDDIDLLVWTRHYRVQVVIMTLDVADRAPPVVVRLLDEFPELLVLGIDLPREKAYTFRKSLQTGSISELFCPGSSTPCLEQLRTLTD